MKHTFLMIVASIAMFAQTSVIKINAGGPVFSNNGMFVADKYFTGGATYTTSLATGVYKDVRHGAFSYNIPVPNGDYTVKLHFAEVFANYHRSFNVDLNGTLVLTGFDPFAEAGGNFPLNKSFDVSVNNLDGINLKFIAGTRSAIVSAIEILSKETKPVEWCPGPVISRTDDKTIVIGANWSDANPCHLNFNIQQPVDPISVQIFTRPVIVKLTEGIVDNGILYVWASRPTGTVGSDIIVGLGNITNATCTGKPNALASCKIQLMNTNPRMFPANTAPMGTMAYFTGVFSPKANNILEGNRQITIGPGASMSLVHTDGVLMVQLDPVVQRLAQVNQSTQDAKLGLELARTKHLATLSQNAPALSTQLTALAAVVAGMQNRIEEINKREPTTTTVIHSKEIQTLLENTQMSIDEVRMKLLGLEGGQENFWNTVHGLRSEIQSAPLTSHVSVPISFADSCDIGTWAASVTYKYECTDTGWIRYKLDSSWKP